MLSSLETWAKITVLGISNRSSMMRNSFFPIDSEASIDVY